MENSEDNRAIAIPVRGGRMVLIEVPTVFSCNDYHDLMRVMTTMKDGIIYEPATHQPKEA